MNILWLHKNGSVIVTHLAPDHDETPQDHAKTLMERGNIPEGFEPVEYAVPDLPEHMPVEVWNYENRKIGMHLGKARSWHKDRLRAERAPFLQALDVQSLRNTELSVNNGPTLKAKQVLRDLPSKIDALTDWAAMVAVSVPQEPVK
jgi:hypothetical protein